MRGSRRLNRSLGEFGKSMEKLKESEPKNYGSISLTLGIFAIFPVLLLPFALVNPALNIFGGCYFVYIAQPSAILSLFFACISVYVWVREGISKKEKVLTLVAIILLAIYLAVAIVNTVAALEQ